MKIINCGDSFTYGDGLVNPAVDSYAAIVSGAMASDYINFGKRAASNFLIYTQVLAAIAQKPDIIIMNTTSTDRLEWLVEPNGAESTTYNFLAPSDNPPVICSDQIHGMFTRSRNIPEHQAKIKAVGDYGVIALDSDVKIAYDIGILCLAYKKIKIAGIHCIVLGNILGPCLSPTIPAGDILDVNFFSLAQRYPDTLNTQHCNEYAHQLVADQIINFITERNTYAEDTLGYIRT